MSLDLLNNDHDKVIYFRDLLIATATGENVSDTDFRKLQTAFLLNKTLSVLFPKWLKEYRDLDSFKKFITKKFVTHASRKEFLLDEFSLLVKFTETTRRTEEVTTENDYGNIQRTTMEYDAEAYAKANAYSLSREQGNYSGLSPIINIRKVSLSVSAVLNILQENVSAVDAVSNTSPAMDLSLHENEDLVAEVRALIEELKKTQALLSQKTDATVLPQASLKDDMIREFCMKLAGSTGEGIGTTIKWGVRISLGLMLMEVLEAFGYSTKELLGALTELKPPSK